MIHGYNRRPQDCRFCSVNTSFCLSLNLAVTDCGSLQCGIVIEPDQRLKLRVISHTEQWVCFLDKLCWTVAFFIKKICGYIFSLEFGFLILNLGKIWMVLLHRLLFKILNLEDTHSMGCPCIPHSTRVFWRSPKEFKEDRNCWKWAFIDFSQFIFYFFFIFKLQMLF